MRICALEFRQKCDGSMPRVWGLSWESQWLELESPERECTLLTSPKGDAGHQLGALIFFCADFSMWPLSTGLVWASHSMVAGFPRVSSPQRESQTAGFHESALAVTQQPDFCCTQLVGRVTSPSSFKGRRNRIYHLTAELQVLEEHVGQAIWF